MKNDEFRPSNLSFTSLTLAQLKKPNGTILEQKKISFNHNQQSLIIFEGAFNLTLILSNVVAFCQLSPSLSMISEAFCKISVLFGLVQNLEILGLADAER